jgi:hypothetical protein
MDLRDFMLIQDAPAVKIWRLSLESLGKLAHARPECCDQFESLAFKFLVQRLPARSRKREQQSADSIHVACGTGIALRIMFQRSGNSRQPDDACFPVCRVFRFRSGDVEFSIARVGTSRVVNVDFAYDASQVERNGDVATFVKCAVAQI